MKELKIEDEIVVAGGLRNNDIDCTDIGHVTIMCSPQGGEPPKCDV
jgi:hypothetical protein